MLIYGIGFLLELTTFAHHDLIVVKIPISMFGLKLWNDRLKFNHDLFNPIKNIFLLTFFILNILP